MMAVKDVVGKIEEIDQKILDLLEQRVALYQQGIDEGEETEQQLEDYDNEGSWEQEADVRGLNVVRLGKIHREVQALCRDSG
jgi:hypothetical protein